MDNYMYKITQKYQSSQSYRYQVFKRNWFFFWDFIESCRTLEEAEEIIKCDLYVKYVTLTK